MAGCCSYTWYPREFYGVVEWLMGLIIGTWLPLQARAGNLDCYHWFWVLVMNLWDWSFIFDAYFEWLPDGDFCLLGTWCSTINGWENFLLNLTKPINTMSTVWSVQNYCLGELEVARLTHWLERFRNKGVVEEDEQIEEFPDYFEWVEK